MSSQEAAGECEEHREDILKTLWSSSREAQRRNDFASATVIVTFFRSLAKNDAWLANIGATILPTLYEAYQELIASFRDVRPSADGVRPSRRYSLVIPSKLQANAAALQHLSSILDLSVDCCDLEERCCAKFLPSFIQATGAILLGTNFAADDVSSDEEGQLGQLSQSTERCACDALRRVASFSLANIVEAVPSCLQGAVEIFQQRHRNLFLSIQSAPEVSVQRSLLCFAITVYKEAIRSTRESKFVQDMDTYLQDLDDEDDEGMRARNGRDLFDAVDLNDDFTALKHVEKFRLFLNEVAFEEDCPATRCVAMPSCHIFMGPKCEKGKEGPMLSATIDWNLRGICLRIEDGGAKAGKDPIHIRYSEIMAGEVAEDAREFSFETKRCDVPFIRVQLSATSLRDTLKETVLPRLSREKVNAFQTVPADPKKYHVLDGCDDVPMTPVLFMKRKSSTPVSEAQPFAAHHRKPEGIQAFSDTASADVDKVQTENLDSVFAGLQPDGLLLLPRLDDDNERDTSLKSKGDSVGDKRTPEDEKDKNNSSRRQDEGIVPSEVLEDMEGCTQPATDESKRRAKSITAPNSRKLQRSGIAKVRKVKVTPAKKAQRKALDAKQKEADSLEIEKVSPKKMDGRENVGDETAMTESPQCSDSPESAPTNAPGHFDGTKAETPSPVAKDVLDTNYTASTPSASTKDTSSSYRDEDHAESPESVFRSVSGSTFSEPVTENASRVAPTEKVADLLKSQETEPAQTVIDNNATEMEVKVPALIDPDDCEPSSSSGEGTDCGSESSSERTAEEDAESDPEKLYLRKLAMVVRATLEQHKEKSAELLKSAEAKIQQHKEQYNIEEGIAKKKLAGNIAKAAAIHKGGIQKERRKLQESVRSTSQRAAASRKRIENLTAELNDASTRHKDKIKAYLKDLSAAETELRTQLSNEARAASARKRKMSSKSSKSDALLAGLSNLLGTSV